VPFKGGTAPQFRCFGMSLGGLCTARESQVFDNIDKPIRSCGTRISNAITTSAIKRGPAALLRAH
jgi:hypothetical protein